LATISSWSKAMLCHPAIRRTVNTGACNAGPAFADSGDHSTRPNIHGGSHVHSKYRPRGRAVLVQSGSRGHMSEKPSRKKCFRWAGPVAPTAESPAALAGIRTSSAVSWRPYGDRRPGRDHALEAIPGNEHIVGASSPWLPSGQRVGYNSPYQNALFFSIPERSRRLRANPRRGIGV